ncbi:hypothetical protein Lser_V15G01452 [Lactuca serriola]
MGLAIIHAPLISLSWGVKMIVLMNLTFLQTSFSSTSHDSCMDLPFLVLAGIMICSCESFVVHLLVKMFLSSKSQLTSFLEFLSLIIYYCLLLLFYDKVMKLGCVSMYSAFIFYFVVFGWLS